MINDHAKEIAEFDVKIKDKNKLYADILNQIDVLFVRVSAFPDLMVDRVEIMSPP